MEWISVKDRLPGKDEYVLCVSVTKDTHNRMTIPYCFIEDGKWAVLYDFVHGLWTFIDNADVLYWMYIPEFDK